MANSKIFGMDGLELEVEHLRQLTTSFDGGGGGGYDHPMEARVAKIEEFVGEARTELRAIDVRLTKIETRLDATATKADVQDTANATIKWVVGTGAVMFSMAVVIITFVLNNATPKPGPTAAPAPIVIYAQPAVPPATLVPFSGALDKPSK